MNETPLPGLELKAITKRIRHGCISRYSSLSLHRDLARHRDIPQDTKIVHRGYRDMTPRACLFGQTFPRPGRASR